MRYLTTADILAVHQILLKRYGGAVGVRDHGAIEAAIFRPQCGYYKDLVEEAVAIFESLLMSHPFVDGNKRVAFAACDIFLRLNNHKLTAEPNWLFQRIMHWIDLKENRFQTMTNDLRPFVQKN